MLGLEASHPLDIVEQIVAAHSWPFERSDIDEINASVAGSWVDFHLSFTWRPDLGVLQLACAFEMKVPQHRQAQVHSLLAIINEQMWIGHFDLWSDGGVLLYRHGQLIKGESMATLEQCESMVTIAVDACERHYPAFQFVLWGGKTAHEALAAAMLECAGEA
jgi:hypothetical protein